MERIQRKHAIFASTGTFSKATISIIICIFGILYYKSIFERGSQTVLSIYYCVPMLSLGNWDTDFIFSGKGTITAEGMANGGDSVSCIEFIICPANMGNDKTTKEEDKTGSVFDRSNCDIRCYDRSDIYISKNYSN